MFVLDNGYLQALSKQNTSSWCCADACVKVLFNKHGMHYLPQCPHPPYNIHTLYLARVHLPQLSSPSQARVEVAWPIRGQENVEQPIGGRHCSLCLALDKMAADLLVSPVLGCGGGPPPNLT